MGFKSIEHSDIKRNVFDMIGKDWLLMTAEDSEGKVNSMTVAWGAMGVLWGEPIVIVAVRPERYTMEFLNDSDYFSLNLFDMNDGGANRKMLAYFGTVSGRDEDKIAKENLTVLHDGKVPYFEENVLSFSCKKIADPQLSEDDFYMPEEFMKKWYEGPNQLDGTGGGLHHLFIGRIDNILLKDGYEI